MKQNMFNENDVVQLTKDLPEENLEAGDKRTILVVVSISPPVYEIEFLNGDGETLAATTVYNQPLNLIWNCEKHNLI